MEDYKEKLKEGWIHVNVIIEILGKPKSYIEQVLKAVLEKMKKEEKMMIVKENVAEPREHKEKGYYTSFVDLEIVIKDLASLQEFIFAYMPSSVEILSPSELNMSLNDLNMILNNMAARLHSYDEFTKKLKIANILMSKKLKQLKPDISEKDFNFEDPAAPKKEESKEDEK